MFWLRGAVVAMSVFMLLYVCLSLVVGRWWQSFARVTGDSSDALFGLRLAPLVLSATVVAAVAIPSFWRFEPRSVEEMMGPASLLLTAGFLTFVVLGLWRAVSAVRQTARSVRRWTCGAAGDHVCGATVSGASDAPPIALAGVRKSRLLISSAAKAVLSPEEMARALAHETSHQRARDNFKKLLLQACAFPGMAGLEQAWLAAIELSADERAVNSQAEALDLAAALVKIARLQSGAELPRLVSGFVDGPAASLEHRIERLLHWNGESHVACRIPMAYASTFAVAVLIACNYLPVLHGMHTITEFLVR